MLAIVQVDGSVRWLSCSPDPVYQMLTAPGIDTGLVNIGDRWMSIDLRNGDVVAEQYGLGSLARPAAQAGSLLLFPPWDVDSIVIKRDRLLLYDLSTGVDRQIAFPEVMAASAPGDYRYELEADGTVLVTQISPYDGSVRAVAAYAADGWTTSPDVLATLFRTRVAIAGPWPGSPTAFDAQGSVVWSRDDVVPFGGEGLHVAVSADVVVVSGCWGNIDPSAGCDRRQLGGIDVTTGDTRWLLDLDARSLAVVADGYAIVSAPLDAGAGWIMVDTDTGEAIAGQEWSDPAAFWAACCADSEFYRVQRDGALVTVTAGRRVHVWYPASASIAPATAVSLP